MSREQAVDSRACPESRLYKVPCAGLPRLSDPCVDIRAQIQQHRRSTTIDAVSKVNLKFFMGASFIVVKTLNGWSSDTRIGVNYIIIIQ